MTVKHEDVGPQHQEVLLNSKARADAVKRLTEIRRAFAWPLHRAPLAKCLVSEFITKGKTRLVLPRSYRAVDGEDRVVVKPYDDLNSVVFRWYEERVVARSEISVNFVTKDGIIARRHEYIGPDPRVAGYHVGNDGNIYIKWWDAFLQDPWVGNGKWSVDVMCNAHGEWVERS